MNLHKSLFHLYEQEDPMERISFTDGYLYNEFIMTLIKDVAKNRDTSKYNKIC